MVALSEPWVGRSPKHATGGRLCRAGLNSQGEERVNQRVSLWN